MWHGEPSSETALPPKSIQFSTARRSVRHSSPPPRTRAKAAARLDLDVSAGWASLSSHAWGGDTLLLSSKVGLASGLELGSGRRETKGCLSHHPIAALGVLQLGRPYGRPLWGLVGLGLAS
jgi:hypothetical protein